MKNGIRLLMTALFGMLCLQGKAQYTFAFMPEVQGRSINNISQVRISNTGSAVTANLRIVVSEASVGTVVTIDIPQFQLLPGTSAVPPGAVYQAAVTFGNTKISTVIRQSGYFPSGDYEYCFQLFEGVSHNSELLAEQCFNYELEPFSNMRLIQPYDEDKICDKRPTFNWQPLIPAINGAQYRLSLVEVKDRQQPIEALRMNLAIVNQRDIPMPMLLYPSIANELVEGKQYAWQVTAYQNDLILAQSEIWSFTVDCEKDSTKLPVEAFRSIEDLSRGNFYIARGQLLFGVTNTYAATDLNYSIRCLTKPDQAVKKLPAVQIVRGYNQVVIDLTDNNSFKDGYYYIMDVNLPDGTRKQLRFIYKTAE
ncbi:hypothetical protein [Chitinophaga sancti]|uniref:DUF928 domain-containing protein n=1 Tax=Chitinophaga sancti TaxID=1004 RepID=A0A1K1R4A8_9BACT|nr:hypothetical protein [Chitinophaga sancti]WQD64277.1 hypothetical protein U0033_07710 [Chitinophaga sancti]WQG90099.1 hypothetical protein SR876_01210 [Chitinophaga sancti]SFW66845.1 hypothetical protein SAMN05661012_03366 [Chitinophaga sancti]